MKTFIKGTSILGVLLMLFMSCSGAKVYNSNDTLAVTSSQKKIAILPPKISMLEGKYTGRFKQSKEQESANFQKEMYAWFLKRFSQNNVSQEIQDIETTNTKLKRAGYPEKELTKSEICAVLGVDAVISSDYMMTKPMPQGVAVAASVLLDYEGTTNEITADMNIYDKNTDKIFWNYSNKYSGGWRSSYSDIVEDLLRNASKKMPYGAKK